MRKLEEGKNYVMVNGEETGPMVKTTHGRFRSTKVRAISHSGDCITTGPQVWNPDGTVYAASVYETNLHTIYLSEPVKRWEAHVTYRLARGFTDTQRFLFEEFSDLGEIIEGGRDFHSIEDIQVRLNKDHLAAMFQKV